MIYYFKTNFFGSLSRKLTLVYRKKEMAIIELRKDGLETRNSGIIQILVPTYREIKFHPVNYQRMSLLKAILFNLTGTYNNSDEYADTDFYIEDKKIASFSKQKSLISYKEEAYRFVHRAFSFKSKLINSEGRVVIKITQRIIGQTTIDFDEKEVDSDLPFIFAAMYRISINNSNSHHR